jgi:fucose permease
VAFQSFVVLVFIWLGDGSRLNKSCLHDLGVPYHHCYRVSSPLLVEFISFWYQSFGSKISFVYLLFSFYFLFLAIIKKKKKRKKKAKKKKEKKKVQNSSKKKKKIFLSIFQQENCYCSRKKNHFISILFQQENSSCSSKKNSSFQSCFSPYLGS